MRDREKFLAYQKAYYHSHKKEQPAKRKYVRHKEPVHRSHAVKEETAYRKTIPEKIELLEKRINALKQQLANANSEQADDLQRQINILNVKILQVQKPVFLQKQD